MSNLEIRLDNFGAKMLIIHEHKMRLVADAVAVELVSASNFPANREVKSIGWK